MTQPRLVRRHVRPVPVAYALLAAFVLAERLLPQGAEAESVQAGQAEQGTTRAIGRTVSQSLLALTMAALL